MAKIEMDMTEYDLMRENKKLLEESLKKERELEKQIANLTKEKIDALENAKMRVVKTKKSEITEHLLRKRDDQSIWRELWNLMGIDYRDQRQYLPPINSYLNISRLGDTFFEKATSISMPVEEITTHGLDEVRNEIREELKSKMDEETSTKLKRADETLSKYDTILKENKKLSDEIESTIGKNKILVERLDTLTEDINGKKKAESILTNINEILKDGYGFWGKSKLLDKVISLAKNDKK